MDKLYQKCVRLVVSNTEVKDRDTIEVLAYSILSLLLVSSDEVLEKIPAILQKLTIYSDNRSVLEVLHEEAKHYGEDDELKDALACVTTKMVPRGKDMIEKNFLILPKSSIHGDPIQMIEKTTHELVHLLRRVSLGKVDNYYVIQDGISTKRVDLKHHETFKKHSALEEAIVQKRAKDATLSLLEYLKHSKGEKDDSLLYGILKEKDSYQSVIYDIHVYLLEMLLEDQDMLQRINDTYQTNDVREVSRYFNNVLDDNGAFLRLSNYFDKLDFALSLGNDKVVYRIIEIIVKEIKSFKEKKKVYKK